MKYRIVTHNGKYRIQSLSGKALKEAMEYDVKIVRYGGKAQGVPDYMWKTIGFEFPDLECCRNQVRLLREAAAHEAGPWVPVECPAESLQAGELDSQQQHDTKTEPVNP